MHRERSCDTYQAKVFNLPSPAYLLHSTTTPVSLGSMDDAVDVTMTTTTTTTNTSLLFDLEEFDAGLASSGQKETYESSSSSSSVFNYPSEAIIDTTPSRYDEEEKDDTTDFLFLGLRALPRAPRTPNNSPNSGSPTSEIPLASLVHLSDDDVTIVTDSYAGVTLPETSLTRAPLDRGPSSTHIHHLGGYKCQGGGGVRESARKLGSEVCCNGERGCCGVSLTTTLAQVPHTCSRLDPLIPVHSSVLSNSSTAVNSATLLTTVSAATSSCIGNASIYHPFSSSSSSSATGGNSRESRILPETVPEKRETITKCQQKKQRRNTECGTMCKDSSIDPGADDVSPNTNNILLSDSVHSQTCAENFTTLSKELSETKDQLFALSLQMEEQASHIAKLMEENRRYLKENGKLKGRRARENNNVFNQESYNCYNNNNIEVYSDPETTIATSDLEDRLMSLQLQNSELNLCLEREKRRRKEAEAKVERDEGYIRRLEDSVQTLRGTRVVMDPSTYRQVAEAYIAARGTPARRPNTHSGVGGMAGSADLVCDASRDSILGHQRLSHPIVHHSSSCPTSPNKYSSPPTLRRMYPKLESQEYQMYPGEISLGRSNKNKKDRSHNSHDLSRGLSVGVNPMNPWDYQQLLKSLEDLDGASRGALS